MVQAQDMVPWTRDMVVSENRLDLNCTYFEVVDDKSC